MFCIFFLIKLHFQCISSIGYQYDWNTRIDLFDFIFFSLNLYFVSNYSNNDDSCYPISKKTNYVFFATMSFVLAIRVTDKYIWIIFMMDAIGYFAQKKQKKEALVTFVWETFCLPQPL